MITTKHAKNDVTINSSGDTNAFTIVANSKAFQTLISGLYADKVQSITREIWSNALDSHIAAGCPDKPFEVTFPSMFDPTFRVRDYGVGLSHADVMGLYTTVFKSTKEDTNTQVGSFGLGSKSPFAYTDTFSVISVYNGAKNYYTALMNEDRIPTIVHLHSEIVDEENGVEVSFPVAKHDVNSFREAAKRVSLGFNVKPLVKDDEDFEWPKDYSEYMYNGLYVKMGCVIYPVDAKVIREAIQNEIFDSGDLTVEFIDLCRSQTLNIFEVPVGSLEVSVSREALSYGRKEPTIPTILKELNSYREKIKTTIESVIDRCPTRYEAFKLISDSDTYFNRNEDMFTDEERHIFSQWFSITYPTYSRNYYNPSSGKEWAKYKGKDIKTPYAFNMKNPLNEFAYARLNDAKGNKIMPDAQFSDKFNIGMNYNKIRIFVVDRYRGREGYKSVNSDTIKMRNIISFLKCDVDEIENHYDTSTIDYDPSVHDMVKGDPFIVEFYGRDPLTKIRFFDLLDEYLVEGVEYEVIDLMSIAVPKKRVYRSPSKNKTLIEKISNYKVTAYDINGAYDVERVGRLINPDDIEYVKDINSGPWKQYASCHLHNKDTDFIVIPKFMDTKKTGIYVYHHYNDVGSLLAQYISKIYKRPVIIIAQSYAKNFLEYYENSISIESEDFEWDAFIQECERITLADKISANSHEFEIPKSCREYTIHENYKDKLNVLEAGKSLYRKMCEKVFDLQSRSCYSPSYEDRKFVSFARGIVNKIPEGYSDALKDALDPNTKDISKFNISGDIRMLKIMIEQLFDNYPMLAHVSSYRYSTLDEKDVSDIIDYVKIMDTIER